MTTVSQSPAKAQKKSAKTKEAVSTSAMAFHNKNGDTHVVGIGNLRVIICKDIDGVWFAQGLEVDYAANGHSVKEVKKNFEEGLAATLDLHIKAYNQIELFLNPAPASVWKELWKAGRHFEYSQISMHADLAKSLGCVFDGVTYIETKEKEGIAA